MPNDKLGDRVARSVPISSFEYVDVFFETANVDVFVEHSLLTNVPDDVQWDVVGINNGGVVYRDGANDRRAWSKGYVILRCTAAGTTARLRLSIPAGSSRPARSTGVPVLPSGGGGASVSDVAYDATTWDGVTTDAPSKNAVRDQIETMLTSIAAKVSDAVYGVGWDGVTGTAPSKNAVYDKIESVIAAAVALISDTVYGAGWDGVTTIAPSKNAVYDKIEAVIAAANALVSDTAYNAGTWDGVTTIAPSKNAVRDKIEALAATIPTVSDTVYGAGWDGDTTTAPSKNAVYDKIQSLSSGTTKPFKDWTAGDNTPPASAAATFDTRNSHAVLDFDGSTDEEAVFNGVLPVSYAGGGLTVEVWCAFTSATSGNVRWQAAIERIDVSSLDIDADSFASFQSAGGTAPGSSGQVIKVAITFTSGAQMDSLAAGEAFRLKIRRDADGTSGTDDITTDAELLRVVLRET
jgi:hypothetical protein